MFDIHPKDLKVQDYSLQVKYLQKIDFKGTCLKRIAPNFEKNSRLIYKTARPAVLLQLTKNLIAVLQSL